MSSLSHSGHKKRVLLSLLFAFGSAVAWAEHTDPAPIDDEVIQKLVTERLAPADPLPERLSTRLGEAAALIEEVEQTDAKNYASESEHGARLSSKHMLLSAKVAELEALRSEVRGRLSATRARLKQAGLTQKTQDWDDLATKVEDRFDRAEHALDQIRLAKDQPGREDALRRAKAELSALSNPAQSHPLDLPAEAKPTLRSDTPQPKRPLTTTDQVPQYVSGTPRGDTGLLSTLGISLFSTSATTSSGTASCGTTSDVSAALAATQDVQITPEITALAASLNYSPAKIYQYVYQTIQYEPYYGSLKGSAATLMAKSGGSTDQASLLIALLRASNIPARFVKGQIDVMEASPDALGGRVGRWVGAKSYTAAAAILGQGQTPSVIVDNNASNQPTGVSLTHVWVEACVPYSHYRGTQQDQVGYRWIPLDPSFKDATYQPGIATNVNFDYTGYLAHRTNMLVDEYYANQVLPTIRSAAIPPNGTNNTLADVPYKGSLNPMDMDILPTSLPYEVSAFLPWDSANLPETADLPDAHRYKFNITVSNNAGTPLLSSTLSMPQTALSRVTLSFQGATAADQTALSTWQNDGTLTAASPTATPCTINVVPVLKGLVNGLEGGTLATGSTASPVGLCITNNRLALSITMAELATPTLNSASYKNINAANYHALMAFAFQTSDRFLTQRAATLLAKVKATSNPNADLDNTEGDFLKLVGLKYMRYCADAAKHIGQLSGASGDQGNDLGLVSSGMKVVYLFDIPFEVARNGFIIDWPGGLSRTADLVTGSMNWKEFLLSGYHGSGIEHYIWQENVRMDAVSTVRGLQFASESGIPLLTLNSANWVAQSVNLGANAGCTTNANLNYPQCWIDNLKTGYIDQGYTVTIPKTLIQYGDWKGEVFVGALDNTGKGLPNQASFIINGYSGGYTVRQSTGQTGVKGMPLTTYDAASGAGYVTPNPSLTLTGTPSNGTPAEPLVTNTGALNNGYDPKYMVLDHGVNAANGNMVRMDHDFSIAGRGGLSIAFDRTYNSRNPQNGPLGYGWTHNFNQFLTFKDDNANNAADAADTDGLTSTVGWTDGTGGEKLFQVTGTAAGVAIGSTFTKVPGTFAAMVRNADGTYSVREKDGTTYSFETIAGTVGQKARLKTISDRNGNTLTLAYTSTCGNNLCTVTDSAARALTFTYDASNHLTKITDWTGRQFQYGYTDGNGNLTSYSNPLAVAGQQPPATFQYFGASDGLYLNHALKQFTAPLGNGLSYEYYATGKLFRRTDSLGNTLTYTYNDFRRETVEVNERNYTRRYFFDQYGNATQIVEGNGATHNYTYDTATASNIYNRLSDQDPQGYTTQFAYDSNGNITQITHPSASTETFSNFTSFNQPGKRKDANGNYTLLKYDVKGNLAQSVQLTQAYCGSHNCATLDPTTYTPAATDMIAWQVYGYDTYGNRTNLKRVRDFTGQVASPTVTSNTGPIYTRTFDSNGLYPTSLNRAGKKNSETTVTTQSATLVYDSLGRLKSGVDADWYPIQFSYDTADRRTQGTDPFGNQRTYDFDANNNATGERLESGGDLVDSRSASYDPKDRLQTATDAGGNVTTYQYDEAGNVKSITDPDNYSQRFEYDESDHLTRSFDQEDNGTVRTLDADGKPRTITDPNSNVTRYSYYDATGDGRLKSMTDPGNHSTSFVYDPNGNATSITVTGNDGSTTRNSAVFYDELNRPVRSVGPQYTDASLGAIRPVTKSVYDSLGNRTQVLAGYTTDATGSNTALDVLTVQTSLAYDDFSRRIKETDPLNQAWVYTFDGNNNISTTLDPLTQTTTYTWGYGHQLASVTDNAGQFYSYTRNLLGQPTLVQSPAVSYTYGYDASHRRSSLLDSRANKSLTFAFSPGGLMNRMTDSDGNRTDYNYDAVGRLTGVWAPNYDYISFAYDPGGRLSEKWIANGVDAQYGYNADNTLASLTNKQGNTTVSSHVYTYDALGNRQTQAETVAGSTLNYTYAYDALNRLTQVQNGTAAQQQNYTFDPLGNRTQKQIGSTVTAYVLDAANQLKEIHNGSATGTLLASLTYDADGNLKTRSDTGISFTYDALNRLTQAMQSGQLTQSYVYDDEGRRIKKTVGSAATNYLYNGSNLLAEYAVTWGAPTAQYTYGPMTDNVITRFTSTATQYFHEDGLNSVMAVTNSLGGTDATERFDAWGNKVSSTGTAPHFGYTGREPDETGLIYYRARYYDPTLGRFTQRDPIGLKGGLNRYAFVTGNPVRFNDPFGLKVGDWWDPKSNYDRARQIAQDELNKHQGHNDADDAMRHAEWSERMANELGDGYAWLFGTGHELDNLIDGGPWRESQMDLHNNEEGRTASDENRPIDPKKLQDSPKDGSAEQAIRDAYEKSQDSRESIYTGEHGGGGSVGNIFQTVSNK